MCSQCGPLRNPHSKNRLLALPPAHPLSRDLGGGAADLTRKAHRTTLDYHEVVHRNIHIKMLSKLLVVASVGLAAGTQRAAFLVLLLVSTTL